MSHLRHPKVDPASVLETFTAMNREFSSEVVVTRDGRVGVRTFVDPAEDPAFEWMSWEDVAAEWPGGRYLSSAVGMNVQEVRRSVARHLSKQLPNTGCTRCGRGPVLSRSEVSSVHPVSGDAYGTLWQKCLDCGVATSSPFADN